MNKIITNNTSCSESPVLCATKTKTRLLSTGSWMPSRLSDIDVKTALTCTYIKNSHYWRISALIAPAFNQPIIRQETDFDGWMDDSQS